MFAYMKVIVDILKGEKILALITMVFRGCERFVASEVIWIEQPINSVSKG